ncbi:hypothetical protein [Limnobacter sp. 130]|uniref:hypothetical protein n=1 Tax=Limnobacter sp. 130 TaxID=2653147 RepID=UPI001359455D|nr:hypothetical protein [Limnobacter sp. 130]
MSIQNFMNARFVSCIGLFGLISVGDARAGEITCNFNKAFVVYLSEPERMEVTNIAQTMRISGEKTAPETLKLDGKLRATNSKSWALLRPDAIDSLSIQYAGSYGDLLALSKKSESSGKGDRLGLHSASLSSTVDEMVVVKKGSCQVSEK